MENNKGGDNVRGSIVQVSVNSPTCMIEIINDTKQESHQLDVKVSRAENGEGKEES